MIDRSRIEIKTISLLVPPSIRLTQASTGGMWNEAIRVDRPMEIDPDLSSRCGGSNSAFDWAEAFRRMLLIREFELRCRRLFAAGAIPGFCHLSVGQEAVAVGVALALCPEDVLTSTHRGHGHSLARGADVTGMFAELLGRRTGLCGGRGGSMHVADVELGILGANGIVGAGLPIAVGAALGQRLQRTGGVALAFFGDGAVAQGAFHEALNLAALWSLPVVFVCENNHYAEFSATAAQHPVPLVERGRGYGIPGVEVDGTDVEAVTAAASSACQRARDGDGPTLLVADTYRWFGHYEGDPAKYRPEDEFEAAKERDPIELAGQHLSGEEREQLTARVAEVIEDALTSAEAAEEPDPKDLHLHVREPARFGSELDPADGQEIRYMDAINRAMADALADDERVYLSGVDVGASGGVFGITRGLQERFGERVLDTPIAEMVLLGSAVGAALVGNRPIVELMFNDFIGVCLDPLLNQAAKLSYMTGGQAHVPLVLRTQFGAGRSSGAQHSQSLEGLFAAIPGLSVVIPSSPADAYGLLRSAIEDPNPVVFMEHRHLYGRKGPPPAVEHRVPIGSANVVRPGRHATVVSWGKMVHTCLEAAERLAKQSKDVEVIDLRTIAPFDRKTVLDSVSRTARLAVVHEAHEAFGPGAEIVATVAREGFWHLDAPIVRIAPPAVPAPYAPSLEQAWLPDTDGVTTALEDLLRV